MQLNTIYKHKIFTRDLAAMLFALSVLPSCATITKGTSQTVTVDTDPPGAACTLSRGGQEIAVVDPTPSPISIKKEKAAITLSCKKDGYLDSTGVIESKFQAMTVGNILFGGVIGAAVDAKSGAMNKYPPEVTITLIPEYFESAAEREAFFDKLKLAFLEESNKAIQELSDQCNSMEGAQCNKEIKAAQAAQQAKLEEIDGKKHLSKVGEK